MFWAKNRVFTKLQQSFKFYFLAILFNFLDRTWFQKCIKPIFFTKLFPKKNLSQKFQVRTRLKSLSVSMGACKVIVFTLFELIANMIKILPNLDKLDANETIDTKLVQIWQFWAILIDLNQFWGIWSNLDKFEPILISLIKIQQLWTTFKFESNLTRLNQFWQV